MLSILNTFPPNSYKNIVFVSVAVVDSGSFKGATEVVVLEESVKHGLERHANLARRLGIAAEYRLAMTTNVVEGAIDICRELHDIYPRSTVFTGQITFRLEKF